MSFVPSLPINNIVENTDIINEFKCSNMGGMRRSRRTNTLVIISFIKVKLNCVGSPIRKYKRVTMVHLAKYGCFQCV